MDMKRVSFSGFLGNEKIFKIEYDIFNKQEYRDFKSEKIYSEQRSIGSNRVKKAKWP